MCAVVRNILETETAQLAIWNVGGTPSAYSDVVLLGSASRMKKTRRHLLSRLVTLPVTTRTAPYLIFPYDDFSCRGFAVRVTGSASSLPPYAYAKLQFEAHPACLLSFFDGRDVRRSPNCHKNVKFAPSKLFGARVRGGIH